MAARWHLLFAGWLIAMVVFVAVAAPARAVTILRDPDIEHALNQLAKPLITAAGLSPSRVRVLVMRNSKLNAFVIDTQTILITSGLLLKMKSADEFQAVVAHEVAHIANGHITRRLSNKRFANNLARFGFLLGVAVAAGSGNAEAGAGIAIGSANSVGRNFLAHTRAEEASADQAGLRYLAQRNIDPEAMIRVLQYFRGQELISPGRQDPYVRSHPLSRDRMRAVQGYAAAYSGSAVKDPAAEYWFARARAKLGAFLQGPGYTLRRVDKNDNSELAIMRRAIAYHRVPKRDLALAEIGKLIKMRPNDPFVHELRGQILLESRNYQAAVAAYGRAVQLAKRNPLTLAGYGRALLALKTRDGNARALKALSEARSRDGRSPRLMRDLATAYARAGQNGMASAVTAERYALIGRLKDAEIHAKRAVGILPQGSVGWNRAMDVLNAAKAAG